MAGAEGVSRVLRFVNEWLKHAALETQEYVRLVAAACRGVVTPPIYRHDIIEQFDLIGIGSLTVVLLTGFFTGAALASQCRSLKRSRFIPVCTIFNGAGGREVTRSAPGTLHRVQPARPAPARA